MDAKFQGHELLSFPSRSNDGPSADVIVRKHPLYVCAMVVKAYKTMTHLQRGRSKASPSIGGSYLGSW